MYMPDIPHTYWCSEVYVDICFGHMGLWLQSHKPPPQQVVYLVYTPLNLGLY